MTIYIFHKTNTFRLWAAPCTSFRFKLSYNMASYNYYLLEYTRGGRWRPACFLNLLIQVIQLDSKHAAALADTLPQK